MLSDHPGSVYYSVPAHEAHTLFFRAGFNSVITSTTAAPEHSLLPLAGIVIPSSAVKNNNCSHADPGTVHVALECCHLCTTQHDRHSARVQRNKPLCHRVSNYVVNPYSQRQNFETCLQRHSKDGNIRQSVLTRGSYCRCCSRFGYCGTDTDHCGNGCLSTCDYKEQTSCDANTPCADGTCCSKYGSCGLGPDYCGDGCTNGCDAKAECDPGYGAEWATYAKCPLNVCCSKWGYCGIDKLHCGDSKVTRPSCPVNGQNITRVIGYFEGWASRRPCDQYTPENIPLGVYSHINFAFAGIDPATFRITPGHPADIGLYTRLTKLKKIDPDLKVYIAIGGWAFNDPGATASVFTDLVASDSNQRAFFSSLLSFMDTYGFDGVDIDWEYPVAEERAGREEDFSNFPKFIANLKSVLDGAGGKGLTITLPVAYWYLRHFDIIKMEPHVDWFNMMSYDLHGAWDSGNKWLGNYLLSHTNLTEITDYFDLMWRNSIKPEKVVMGLAFYSRTFKATSGGCMEPNCTFSSVADAGPCTGEAGVLSNAEIDARISSTGAVPQLDKKAAVQILKIGTDWITYDNLDTWKIKTDFVRSQCLGGVMVWAISLDKSDGRYSKELQKATGFLSKGVTIDDLNGGYVVNPDERITRDQCRWTNCGASCPANFVPVRRSDDDGNGETMVDSTACRHNGGVRTLCCPGAARMPICGWFDFNNGKCGYWHGSQCPDASSDISKKLGVTSWGEVGSYSGACSHSAGFQVACCSNGEKDAHSADLYGACKWRGKSEYGYEPTCSDGTDYTQCSNFDQSFFQVNAWSGSGAVNCYHYENDLYYHQTKVRKQRSYCCDTPTEDKKWGECRWAGVKADDDGFCESSCSNDEVRVAMNGGDKVSGCSSGAENYCCNPSYKLANSPSEESTQFAVALGVVMDHQGQCLREGDASKAARGTATDDDATDLSPSMVESRQAPMNVFDACNIVSKDLRYFLTRGSTIKGSKLAGAWDAVVKPEYGLLSASSVDQRLDGIEYLGEREADSMARNLANNLQTFESYSEAEAMEDETRCPYPWYISFGYNTFGDDEDDGGFDDGPGFSYVYGGGDGGTFDKKRSVDQSVPSTSSDSMGRMELSPFSGDDSETARIISKPGIDPIYRDRLDDDELVEMFKKLTTTERSLNHTHAPLRSDMGPEEGELEDTDLLYSILEERADQFGNPRPFTAKKGTSQAITMSSESYPNGDGGDQLIRENGDSSRYLAKIQHYTGFSCSPDDYQLIGNALKIATKNHWVSEHILELQTIPRFIEFIANQEWPQIKGANIPSKRWSGTPTDSAFIMRALKDYGTRKDWNAWKNLGPEYAANSPLNLMLNRLGSVDSVDVMVIADSDLNGVKAELYRFNRPRGNTKWAACCSRADPESGRKALSVLQNSLAVFDYYDDTNVKAKHRRAYDKVKSLWRDFDTAFNAETGLALPQNPADLWQEYMIEHFNRVVLWSKVSACPFPPSDITFPFELLHWVSSNDKQRWLLPTEVTPAEEYD